jgi:hypothetical protein
MAAAIPNRAAQNARGRDGSERDARLAARARTRRAVQQGLFERRAQRDADEADAAATVGQHEIPRPDDAPSSSATTLRPEPVLLLFVTS